MSEPFALLRVVVAASVVCVAAACHPATARSCGSAPPPPSVPLYDAPASCGSVGHWEYHFDRNAIASSRLVGNDILAIVEAGHILRFAADSLKATGERLSAERALTWGPVRGGYVVAGFAGGRIARVHASTLSIETVANVPGDPQWIGEMPSGHLVVAYRVAIAIPPPYARRAVRVRVLETGLDVPVGDSFREAFFIDNRGRLWMGTYSGEFGGVLSMVDLSRRDARCVALNELGNESEAYSGDGIIGFLSAANDGVWVYGGSAFFSLQHASITELLPDQAPREVYFQVDDDLVKTVERRPPERPVAPITQIHRATPNRLFVTTGDGCIFETDDKLRRWNRIAQFAGRFVDEGSESTFDRPAVVDVHLVGHRLVLATRRHGYFELVDGRLVGHALPNQIGAVAEDAFLWGETLVVSEPSHPPKAFRDGAWQPAHPLIDPPVPPDRRHDAGEAVHWREVHWTLAEDGELWIVASAASSLETTYERVPTRLQVGRWMQGSFKVVADEMTTMRPSRVYPYPGGTLIATDFENGSWMLRGQEWRRIDSSRDTPMLGPYVAPFGAAHIVRTDSHSEGRLLLFDTSREPAVKEIDTFGNQVRDALAWDSSHLLVSTNSALCLHELGASSCSPWPHALRANPIQLLARDAQRRVWLAGRGLFALDEGHHLVRFDVAGSFLKDVEVSAMHPARDRLVLALGERGVVIVDTTSASRGSSCRDR